MPGVSRRPSVFAALMSLCFPETPSQEAPVEGAVGQRSAVERKLPPRVESCAAVGDSSGSKVHCRFRPSPGVVELVFVISFVSFVGLQPRSASLHKLRLPRLYVQRDFLAKLFALCALQLSMCLVTALVVHAAVKNQAPRLSQAVQQCSPHAVFAVLHSAGRLLRSLPRSHERSLLAPAALPSQCTVQKGQQTVRWQLVDQLPSKQLVNISFCLAVLLVLCRLRCRMSMMATTAASPRPAIATLLKSSSAMGHGGSSLLVD